MKGVRPINSLILTPGQLLVLFHFNSRFCQLISWDAYEVGVWRTMGSHRHDDRLSDAHVLPVDMSLVL